MDAGKGLMLAGVVIALAGAILWAGGRIGPGRLPGDIVGFGGGFRIYAPIATSILISVVLTVVLNVIVRVWR